MSTYNPKAHGTSGSNTEANMQIMVEAACKAYADSLQNTQDHILATVSGSMYEFPWYGFHAFELSRSCFSVLRSRGYTVQAVFYPQHTLGEQLDSYGQTIDTMVERLLELRLDQRRHTPNQSQSNTSGSESADPIDCISEDEDPLIKTTTHASRQGSLLLELDKEGNLENLGKRIPDGIIATQVVFDIEGIEPIRVPSLVYEQKPCKPTDEEDINAIRSRMRTVLAFQVVDQAILAGDMRQGVSFLADDDPVICVLVCIGPFYSYFEIKPKTSKRVATSEEPADDPNDLQFHPGDRHMHKQKTRRSGQKRRGSAKAQATTKRSKASRVAQIKMKSEKAIAELARIGDFWIRPGVGASEAQKRLAQIFPEDFTPKKAEKGSELEGMDLIRSRIHETLPRAWLHNPERDGYPKDLIQDFAHRMREAAKRALQGYEEEMGKALTSGIGASQKEVGEESSDEDKVEDEEEEHDKGRLQKVGIREGAGDLGRQGSRRVATEEGLAGGRATAKSTGGGDAKKKAVKTGKKSGK